MLRIALSKSSSTATVAKRPAGCMRSSQKRRPSWFTRMAPLSNIAGEGASDATNNALLVEKLRDVPAGERSARYRAVIVFMRHAGDPSPLICEGSWEGMIQLTPQGDGGFGYDPYFYLPELGCTSAELSAAEKNRLSHRGQALRALHERIARGA